MSKKKVIGKGEYKMLKLSVMFLIIAMLGYITYNMPNYYLPFTKDILSVIIIIVSVLMLKISRSG